jgi:hypothetical protein
VVDSLGGQPTHDFDLSTGFEPLRTEGQTCSTAGFSLLRCAPGLTCEDVSSSERCAINHAPVLDSIEAVRGGRSGDDLIVKVAGRDLNGNQRGGLLGVFDEAGEPVLVRSSTHNGPLDTHIIYAGIANSQKHVEFAGFFVVPDLFASFPQVHSVEYTLRDSDLAVSETLRRVVGQPAEKRLGEGCDWLVQADRCVEGAICLPDGSQGICEELASAREAVCLDAPTITVDAPFQGRWPSVGAPEGISLWETPTTCLDSSPEAGGYLRETVVRLSLAEALYDVTLRTSSPGNVADTALLLLPGCGVSDEELLACNDDTGVNSSVIELEMLPAGEYLLVVDAKRTSGSQGWTLLVTGQPAP